MKNIALVLDYNRTYSLAAQQNAYPLFHSLRLHYHVSDNDSPQDLSPLRDLVVRLMAVPEFFAVEEWPVDEINPSQTISLQKRPLNIPHNILFELTEEITLTVTLTVCPSDNPNAVYWKKDISVTVLPANYWGGESRQSELLAAFVKPNGTYVESLVR